MRRIKLTIAYDGTNYKGWQIQQPSPEQPAGCVPTIQGCLQRALGELLPKEAAFLPVVGASRTDSGVHALGNVACFDTESKIPTANFPKAVNRFLPPDIRVMKAEEVSMDFHPRFVPHTKCYEYHMDNGPQANPLTRLYAYHCTYPLDLDRMRVAAEKLVGIHDFTSFVNPDSQVFEHGGNAIREIYSIDIEKSGTMLVFRFRGNGFLYHMIRILVGTLLIVGNGRRAPEEIETMLAAKDRTAAGPTVPAHGLCLCALEYPADLTASEGAERSAE